MPFARVTTGGSGKHFAVRGEQEQVLRGFIEQMAVKLRTELHLADASAAVAE